MQRVSRLSGTSRRARAHSGKPVLPVARPASMVRECDHPNHGRFDVVNDAERKPPDERPAHVEVPRDARYTAARPRKRRNQFERSLDLEAEVVTEPGGVLLVAIYSRSKLILGVVEDDERVAQRVRCSRSARTSSHRRPLASPRRMRSTRAAISAVQAASTASSGAPSRLARSSTASSALWPRGKAIASWRMSSAALVIGQ